MTKDGINSMIVYIVTFFLFSGFQAILVCFFWFNSIELSRYATIPLRVFLMVIMFAFMINNPAKNNKNIINLNSFLLIVLAGFYVLKIFYSENNFYNYRELSRSWYEYLFYFLSYDIITYFFYSHVNFEKYKKQIIHATIFSGFLFGFFTIIVYFDYIVSGDLGRLSYLKYKTGEDTINPLALAYSAVINVSCIFFVIFFSNYKINKKTKLFFVVTSFISLVMFFIGSSRGALLTLIIIFSIVLFYVNYQKKIFVIILSIIAIPPIIYLYNFVGSDIMDRTTAAINERADSGRGLLKKEALEEFLRYPLFGGQIEVSGTYPHNIFVELLMGTGLFGLTLFGWFLIRHVFMLHRIVNTKTDSIFIVFMFLNGFIQYNFSGAFWGAILLFFPLGLINSMYKEK